MRRLSLLPLLLLPACMVPTGRTADDILRDGNTRVVKSGWDQYDDERSRMVNEVHDARSGRDRGRLRRPLEAPYGWCLSLAVLTGRDRLAQARRLADRHKIEKPLFAERDGALELLVARYDKPDDGNIVSDLGRWQRIRQEDGSRPFETAALRALPVAREPSDDPLDAGRFFGYATVLVAFYTEDYGKEWKEEARRVARILRKEGPDGQGGVEAFVKVNEEKKEAAVVVGLFTRHDDWTRKPTADPRGGHTFYTDAPGPMVDALVARFPFLLKNGRKIPLGGDGVSGAGTDFAKPSLSEL